PADRSRLRPGPSVKGAAPGRRRGAFFPRRRGVSPLEVRGRRPRGKKALEESRDVIGSRHEAGGAGGPRRQEKRLTGLGTKPHRRRRRAFALLMARDQGVRDFGRPTGGTGMNTFASFDGTRIAYHDEGAGPAVILLHGFGTDGLTQFGDFDRLRRQFDTLRALFREHMGFEPPRPEPPAEGRPGLILRLRAAGARVVVPDLRGFGASDKPRDPTAYPRSAMARDALALIEHLELDTVDVLGFSMGSLTAATLLALGAAPVKSAILSGVGPYILEGEVIELPANYPMAAHLPRPLTLRT